MSSNLSANKKDESDKQMKKRQNIMLLVVTGCKLKFAKYCTTSKGRKKRKRNEMNLLKQPIDTKGKKRRGNRAKWRLYHVEYYIPQYGEGY